MSISDMRVRMKKGPDPVQQRKKPGPLRQWDENMQARFKAGTINRIDAVLRDRETRVAFVNDAVLRELARREKKK
jgi:hypothetical protein